MVLLPHSKLHERAISVQSRPESLDTWLTGVVGNIRVVTHSTVQGDWRCMLLVNILFMVPRMVYCSIINLIWSLVSKMSTTFRSVSYGPCSRTGVTCVASDFGRIFWLWMAGRWYPWSLEALCLMYMASFTFLLCQLDSRVSIFVFFMDTECPVARQWSSIPVGLSRFVCSLNLCQYVNKVRSWRIETSYSSSTLISKVS